MMRTQHLVRELKTQVNQRFIPLTKLEKSFINNPRDIPIIVIDNKFPTMFAVRQLQRIIGKAIEEDCFPYFSLPHIINIVSQVVGCDIRTQDKYLVCLRTFQISRTGQNFTYYTNWDLSDLYKTLKVFTDNKLELSIKNERERKAIREKRRTPRQWCTFCHRNKRVDGSCRWLHD